MPKLNVYKASLSIFLKFMRTMIEKNEKNITKYRPIVAYSEFGRIDELIIFKSHEKIIALITF